VTNNSQPLILWRSANSLLSIEDLANAAYLHPRRVQKFVHLGLLEPSAESGSGPLFPVSSVDRLQRILRLKRDLGINFSGIAVVLELRERIENLQNELRSLRGRANVAHEMEH
jgi:DNA-binding transcriptional MerR regulator